MVGDVVMIQYSGKCVPATYRLGVVTAVVVESDGPVRTVEVEYSILAELPVAERLAYKGITKKRIRVAVQRLVLILPVEEREQDSFCGGQAVSAGQIHGGQGDGVPGHGEQRAEGEHDEPEHGVAIPGQGEQGADGVLAEQGVEVPGQGEQGAEGVPAAADGQEDVGGEHGDLGVVDAALDDHEGDVGGDGSRLTQSSVRGLYRSCQILMKKVKCVDHEKTIYLITGQ